MRLMFKALVPALAGGLIVTMAPAASAAPVVPDSLFGQHVSTLPGGVPGTLSSVGAIRLWDSGVSWRDLEPSRDGYNWAPLVAAVSNAKTLGASEIMYTMGVTPQWAASNPNSSKALYGPGSNSHPASTADYVDFIDDMLRAVPGITAVQIWNEANLQDFYQGTPAQMAELTKAAAPVIRARGAKVVAASTTMRKTGPTQKFGKSYGAAMKKARAWSSVDVLSVHLYPPAKEGPATRVAYIKKTKSYYRKYGAGKKPLWDTEMNFGDLRGYMKVKRAYTGTAAQTYVARTFIDSMRYGVQRVFWYGWDFNVLGTAMTQGGTLREGGVAFQEVRSWMSGKQWLGCKVKSSVTLMQGRRADGRAVHRLRLEGQDDEGPGRGTLRRDCWMARDSRSVRPTGSRSSRCCCAADLTTATPGSPRPSGRGLPGVAGYFGFWAYCEAIGPDCPTYLEFRSTWP